MASPIQAHFKSELDAIVSEFREAAPTSDYDDLSDLGDEFALRMTTRARAAVERVAGPASAYASQMQAILSRPKENDFSRLAMAMGVVEALRADIDAGYLQTLPQLIHAEVFADYLEMADHLLAEGYKDPAAVLAGGTLEGHLRQLCQTTGVPTTASTTSGTKPKKAEQMNTDLAHAGVLTKLDSKNVTAWLDLRNKAAHAKYNEYTSEQVKLMIASVRDFITRMPA